MSGSGKLIELRKSAIAQQEKKEAGGWTSPGDL
jgi:hypothetical protein